jgi:hypothetical protein
MGLQISLTIFGALCFSVFTIASAQQPEVINYEEQKVGRYTLPALLSTNDGRIIKTANEWERIRRPQILQLYQQHVYGKMPPGPKGMHYRINAVNEAAVGGKAVCKQVTVFFTPGESGPGMDILLYLPKRTKGPVPVFAGLNFFGNQSVTRDTTVAITTRWVMNSNEGGINDHKAGERSRAMQSSRWPVELLIDKGFGLATAYYGDLEPDHEEGWKEGIRGKLARELDVKPEEWSAIGAWAWGLSRMLDYLQTEPQIDARKVILTGHSRLGKAAIWAGANDTRFAALVSNNSGEGGAALFRRNFGETIERINTAFPHWFVPAFKSYNGRPEALPVDQHMLLSLIAPRPLYVASAKEDTWADPRGEFLGAYHTTPVYRLYRKKALGTDKMPSVNQPVGVSVRYHIRTGKHDINRYDWEQYIRFALELVR